MSHTPEPWEAFTDCPGECCWMIRTVEDSEGHSELIASPETSEENARRIVACVNALAGLSIESIGLIRARKHDTKIMIGGTNET